MDNIIFIDFSSSSCAICLFKVKEKEYNYYCFFNHHEISKNKTYDLRKNEVMKLIWDNVNFKFFFRKSMSRPKGNPTEFSVKNITDCYNISKEFKDFFNEITKDLDMKKTIIGWEDYPVGIKSNNQLELAELTMSCKKELFEYKDRLRFYLPQDVKGMTGNGNAKKEEMLLAFVKKNIKNNLHNIIASNYKKFILSKGKVKKPIEDIVDSFWGVQLIRKELDL